MSAKKMPIFYGLQFSFNILFFKMSVRAIKRFLDGMESDDDVEIIWTFRKR